MPVYEMSVYAIATCATGFALWAAGRLLDLMRTWSQARTMQARAQAQSYRLEACEQEVHRLQDGIVMYLRGESLDPSDYETECIHGARPWEDCPRCTEDHFEMLLQDYDA